MFIRCRGDRRRYTTQQRPARVTASCPSNRDPMHILDFKRILTTFADSDADLDIAKGTMLAQVRDEVIVAKLYQQEGELIVEEDDQRLPARKWLVNRIARLPLLADRILSYVPETQG